MGRRKKGWKHFLIVFLGSFIIAAVVGAGSELLMSRTSIFTASLFLLAVIITGIVFDIIGIAAAAATEAPHHARASNQVFGARQAVFVVRHADVVASFANDVVGDVSGTLSGVLAATIVLDLLHYYPSLQSQEIWLNTGMLALAASLTITGKALGKSVGINEADEIVRVVGAILGTVEKITGLNFTKPKKRGGQKNGAARKNS